MNPLKKLLWITLVIGWMSPAAFADVVYDNSSERSTPARFPSRKFELGEEIVLAGKGTWILTNFQYEYYGSGPDFVSGNAKIRLRIYKNDGPKDLNNVPTPSTLLYDSGFATAPKTGDGGNVMEYHDLSVPVPKNFTWTVEFGGLTDPSSGGLQQSAGLDLYHAPTIGSTFDDYWEKDGVGPGGWELRKANPADHLPINFGCRVYATYVGPPEITIRPHGLTVECVGDTAATFSVTAIGTPPLTYQWYKDTKKIDGATSTSLVIDTVGGADVGDYYVTVSNAAGTASSPPVSLELTSTKPCFRISPGPTPDRVTVSWVKVSGTSWILQHTFSLNPPVKWVTTPLVPTLKDGEYSVVISFDKAHFAQKYFRLMKP